jgi:hypothetical protein
LVFIHLRKLNNNKKKKKKSDNREQNKFRKAMYHLSLQLPQVVTTLVGLFENIFCESTSIYDLLSAVVPWLLPSSLVSGFSVMPIQGKRFSNSIL